MITTIEQLSQLDVGTMVELNNGRYAEIRGVLLGNVHVRYIGAFGTAIVNQMDLPATVK